MYFVSDRGERHLQPLHPEARDEGGQAGHDVRRLRRHDAEHRRPLDRLRAGRPPPRLRHVRPARTASSPWRCPPTAGPCADRTINPRDYIHIGRTCPNDGKTVVLEARGDVFRVPAGHGPGREPVQDPGHARDAIRPSRPTARPSLSSPTRRATTSSTPRASRAASGRRSRPTSTAPSTAWSGRRTARRSSSATRTTPSSTSTWPRRSWSRSTRRTR